MSAIRTAEGDPIIGPVRLSFLSVFEPKSSSMKKANGEPTDPKYSVVCLIPKEPCEQNDDPASDIEMMRQEIALAAARKFQVKDAAGKAVPYRKPLRDGDQSYDDKDPQYPGYYYFTASANVEFPPALIDRNKRDLRAPGADRTWQSGDWGRVKLRLFGYTNVNKGVSVGLSAVQFTHVDDHFSAASNNAGGFDAYGVGDEATDNDPFADE